jgi:hypothetical protein
MPTPRKVAFIMNACYAVGIIRRKAYAMRKRRDNIIDEHILIRNTNGAFDKATTALHPLLASTDYHPDGLSETLRELGFIVGYRDNGDISALWYTGNDDGIRNETLQALAPFIDNDGFIIWRGVGDLRLRNEFHDGTMTTLEARTVWVKRGSPKTDTPVLQ